MKKYITLAISSLSFLFSCKNGSNNTTLPSKVNHNTLLVATDGEILNFNLDENKIVWEYKSKFDTAGNRNYYVIDGQNIFMPFESGKFINFDLNTGKVIWKKEIFGNENDAVAMSSDENQEAEMLETLKPLFMTTPMVDGENILIASTGTEMQSRGYLYCYNRKNGESKWNSDLPTVGNFYAPVKYRDNYFFNSAWYLNKYTTDVGVNTSYGMFDGDAQVAGEPEKTNPPNQFEKMIYNQMQTNGESLFIGDENGKFYCFELDKNANLPDGDITDPNNTFIKNPKLFKWTFSDKEFDFQKSHITFLVDNTLFVEMKTGLADKSCLFALDADNGKVKWKKVVKGDINIWNLRDGKIMGNTENTMFWLDANGENFVEMQTENKILSNIDLFDKSSLIYVTKQGIETLDMNTKKAKLTFAKPFRVNDYNNLQIKYIGK